MKYLVLALGLFLSMSAYAGQPNQPVYTTVPINVKHVAGCQYVPIQDADGSTLVILQICFK